MVMKCLGPVNIDKSSNNLETQPPYPLMVINNKINDLMESGLFELWFDF